MSTTPAQGSPAIGVVAESRIATEHGLVTAEELSSVVELLGPVVVAARGKPCLALSSVMSGPQPTLTVETRHGYTLTCGPAQRVLVFGADLQLSWRPAEKLSQGEVLCLPRSTGVRPPGAGEIAPGFGESLAATELAGVFCGYRETLAEGCALHVNGHPTALRIARLASRVFDPELSFKVEGIFDQQRVELEHGGVPEFLEALESSGAEPDGGALPEKIFRGDAAETARFLHGLCASTSGSYPVAGVWYLEFMARSRRTAEDIKLALLATLGIVSGRVYPVAGEGFVVRAGGRENLRRFFRHIEAPVRLAGKTRSGRRSPIRPAPLSHSKITAGWSRDFREAQAGDYLLEPVRCVRPSESMICHSLLVPEGESFIANGFLVKAVAD